MSVIPVVLMVFNESRLACPISFNGLRCIKTAKIAESIRIVPGEYKISHSDAIDSKFKMLFQEISIRVL